MKLFNDYISTVDELKGIIDCECVLLTETPQQPKLQYWIPTPDYAWIVDVECDVDNSPTKATLREVLNRGIVKTLRLRKFKPETAGLTEIFKYRRPCTALAS